MPEKVDMKIVSTNLAQPVTIHWNGQDRTTGIFKYPTPEGIYLTMEGVRGDTIGNPKVHGGSSKAAYLYSQDQYDFWKAQYPGLLWEYGMFGENLTVEGLDEKSLRMGNTYAIGEARVRITTPREPCFKLGIRFEDQGIIKKFVDHGYPGTYISVFEQGWVRPGDRMELLEDNSSRISIADFFRLWYAEQKDPDLIEQALQNEWLPGEKRNQMMRWLK